MAAITGTVGRPYHSLAVEHPFRVAVGITALCQIGCLAASVGFYECDVFVVPSSHANVRSKKPLAVRRPLIVLIAVTV